MFYSLKIKKNDLNITLVSENSQLIANEFGKFVAGFLGINFQENSINSSNLKNSENVIEAKVETVNSSPLPNNFAELLASKSTQETNVIEKRTSELRNAYIQMQAITKEKNLKDEIDYIVAAAYCICHYEGADRFTEEQIRAKIAPFFDEELHHNFILDAVAKNFIKVLPDFTGISDTIEFVLTQQGEEYFLNEI